MISAVDLKYFTELARTLHVSRAADRLGITQPALSHGLKRIEEQVGAKLFNRSKKGLTLTPAGQRVLEKAEELSKLWVDVLESANDENDKVTGIIHLGVHSAVAQYTLPKLLQKFINSYPSVTFQLHHGLSRHINEQVISNKLDVGFVVNPSPQPDLIIKEVLKDRVSLWKSQNLENTDVLICDPLLLQTQNILSKLHKNGFHFKRVIESTSLEVISQLVVAGVGYGILPERVIRTSAGIIKIHNPPTAPFFLDRICLVYKQEFRRLKRGQTFVEFALKHLNE